MDGLVNFEDEKEVKQFLDNLGMEYHYQCYFEKDPDGWQRLADYLENVIKNNALAARVLRHNCEVDEQSESCYKLGGYYATGKGGVTECLKTAYSCFIKACDAKEKRSAGACHFAGLLAYDGRVLGGDT